MIKLVVRTVNSTAECWNIVTEWLCHKNECIACQIIIFECIFSIGYFIENYFLLLGKPFSCKGSTKRIIAFDFESYCTRFTMAVWSSLMNTCNGKLRFNRCCFSSPSRKTPSFIVQFSSSARHNVVIEVMIYSYLDIKFRMLIFRQPNIYVRSKVRNSNKTIISIAILLLVKWYQSRTWFAGSVF